MEGSLVDSLRFQKWHLPWRCEVWRAIWERLHLRYLQRVQVAEEELLGSSAGRSSYWPMLFVNTPDFFRERWVVKVVQRWAVAVTAVNPETYGLVEGVAVLAVLSSPNQ